MASVLSRRLLPELLVTRASLTRVACGTCGTRCHNSGSNPVDLIHYQRALATDGALSPLYMKHWLLDAVEDAGGQRALARVLNVRQSDISIAVTGQRVVSTRLASALGFTKTVHRATRYRSRENAEITLDPAQMRALVAEAVRQAHGQQALSRLTGVSQRHIWRALHGLRPVSESLAAALGFSRVDERETWYRPVHWSEPTISTQAHTLPTAAA